MSVRKTEQLGEIRLSINEGTLGISGGPITFVGYVLTPEYSMTGERFVKQAVKRRRLTGSETQGYSVFADKLTEQQTKGKRLLPDWAEKADRCR